jgi:hypothetical protein
MPLYRTALCFPVSRALARLFALEETGNIAAHYEPDQ